MHDVTKRDWAIVRLRTEDRIPPRPVTWGHRIGVAMGSLAMLAMSSQSAIDLQLQRLDRDRIQAKYRLLASYGISRDQVEREFRAFQAARNTPFTTTITEAERSEMLALFRRVAEEIRSGERSPNPPSYTGGVEITWDHLRLLTTPTSDQALEALVAKVYERLAGEFLTQSLNRNIPLPDNFTLGAPGYMVCGPGTGGSHSSSGGCHVCTIVGTGNSERNRRVLARYLKRVFSKHGTRFSRVLAKAAGEGDMDTFAAAWFATWPPHQQDVLIKEAKELAHASRANGAAFDPVTHLMNQVIAAAILTLGNRKSNPQGEISLPPLSQVVVIDPAEGRSLISARSLWNSRPADPA